MGDSKSHFLLKFMVAIHTTYATMRMPSPRGIITIKADQRDALTCENASLSHARHFGDKGAREQSTKVAKMQGGSTPRTPSAKKGTYMALPSTQLPTDQPADDKKKGVVDKEILADPGNSDKKLRISTVLDPK
jgi:hypothetical protein